MATAPLGARDGWAQLPGLIGTGGGFIDIPHQGVSYTGPLRNAWFFEVWAVCRGPVQVCAVLAGGGYPPPTGSGAFLGPYAFPPSLAVGDFLAFELRAGIVGGPTVTAKTDAGGSAQFHDSFFDIFVDIQLSSLAGGGWNLKAKASGSDTQGFDFAGTLDRSFDRSSVVPEPVTLALLGTGLAGIGGARWRRRRREKD